MTGTADMQNPLEQNPAKYLQIANDARKFAAQFAGLVKLGEALGQIGSIQQAVSEAERRLAQAKEGEAEAVRNAATKVQELERRHEQKISDLDRAKADREVRDAKEVDAARLKREAMIADAHKDVEVIKASAVDYERRVAELKQLLSDHHSAVDAKRKEYATVVLQVNEAKAALEHARQEHQTFLAKIGAK